MMRNAVLEPKKGQAGPLVRNLDAIEVDVCDGDVEDQSLAQGLEKTKRISGLHLDSTTSEKSKIRYLK